MKQKARNMCDKKGKTQCALATRTTPRAEVFLSFERGGLCYRSILCAFVSLI